MLAPGKHSTNYGLDNPKSRGIIPNRDISTRPEKEKDMPLIKGTENMQRFPGSFGMGNSRGIYHYGFTVYREQRVLKVPSRNVTQLERLGYRCVGAGNHYAYVTRPDES